MSNHKCPCCCDHQDYVGVEQMTLDDGRRAERHVLHDNEGNEVVEVFAEEKRPLKLEKRIVREHKNVVSKEIHETIRDGEIAHVEVRSLEENIPLQVRERLGLADHHKVVDGDYVRKDEIDKLVADGVIAGVAALMENSEPVIHSKEVVHHHHEQVLDDAPTPILSAQSIVEKNVEEKKGNDTLVNFVLGVILMAQFAFFGYMFFVM